MREKSKSAKTDGRIVENLRDNPHFIESLVETAPNVLYIFDLDAYVNIFLSAQAARLLGYSSGEFHESQNDFLDKFMHPEDLIEIKNYFGKIERANNGEVFEFEYRMRHKSGQWRWFRSRDKVFRRDASGKPTEILGTAFDITDSKRAEEDLRVSRQRYQTLAEVSPYAIFINQKDRIVYLNRECVNLFGAGSPDEIIGKSPFEIFHPDYHDIIKKRVAAMSAKSQIVPTIEEKIVRLDGAIIDVDVAAVTFVENNEPAILVALRDITERKQAEEQLRRNHETFYKLVLNAPFGVYVVDADFRLAQISKGSQKVFSGIEPLIGRDFAEILQIIWTEPFAAEAIGRFRHTLTTGETYIAADINKKRGNIEDEESYDWKIERVTLPDGRFGVVCYFYDLTERLQFEEKLRQSEERFRNLADNISQLAWMADDSGSIFWYNERWYEFTGTTFDEMKGWGWQTVHHPDYVEPVTEKFKKAIADGTDWEDTFPIRSKDGEYCWFLSRAMPIHDEAGKIVRWFGTNTDVTENRRAALNSEFLASIGNVLAHISKPDEIMRVVGEKIGKFLGVSRCIFTEYDKATDEAAIIYDWSDTGKSSLVGVYKIADFIDEDVFAVLSSGKQLVVSDTATDERTSAKAEKHAALEIGAFANSPYLSDGRWKASLTVHNRTPRQWRDDELAILKDLASRAWVRIERARAEAERERLLERERDLRRQAEDANRLKDEFLATVSHELRTPLNAILGWANLLQSGRATEEMIERANETIYRSAKAQAQLIEDLLDISRIITGKMKFEPLPVNLAEVVETAIDTIRPAADTKAISINTNYKDSCIVGGEAQRLQQIVWNLVSNAVKFTPENGLIEITLEVIDKHAVLIVKDSGKGIEAEFLPHIFERFRQEDASSTRRHGGLGLGLAIVRQLVELHGGTISADSAGENLGSTFTLELPLLISNGDKSKNLRESLSDGFTENHISKKLNSIKILLVDDELDTLELLELSLKAEGANVRAANSAATALEILQNFLPDVLISDIAMPDEDGYSLVKKVKQIADEKGINIPAIAMTAYVRVEDRNRVLASGFQMYVPKPAEPDELINAIAVLSAKT